MRKRNATPFAVSRTYAPANTIDVSWRYLVLIIACTGVMAAGFFLAARQHFNTMDLGMKNSKLRNQVEELNAEQRRLILAREVALSPASIRKTARGLGFVEKETAVASAAATKSAPVAPAKAVAVKAETVSRPAGGLVIKTALSERSAKPVAGPDRTVRRSVLQHEKNDRDEPRLIAALR